MMLNHSHKLSPNMTDDQRLEKVIEDLWAVKEKIKLNIIENEEPM